MTSLVGNATSPVKDGTSSLPRRQSSFARPPLRALYDLLVAPMEGVSARPRAPWRQDTSLPAQHPHTPQTKNRLLRQKRFSRPGASLSNFSVSVQKPKWTCVLGWLLVSGWALSSKWAGRSGFRSQPGSLLAGRSVWPL